MASRLQTIVADRQRAREHAKRVREALAKLNIEDHVAIARSALAAADGAIAQRRLHEANILQETYAQLRECAHAAYRAAGLLRQSMKALKDHE